jgi:hypothetical protein
MSHGILFQGTVVDILPVCSNPFVLSIQEVACYSMKAIDSSL